MNLKKPIAPIQHPTLADHHRVPIICVDNKYEIYVGENHIRIFNEDELPDIVKSRLTMIRANVSPAAPPDYVSLSKAYESPSEHLANIGWHPCEGLYVVVIPTKDLTYMMEKAYNAPLSYRRAEANFIVANDRPTFRTLEEYEHWFLRLRLGLKEK